MLAEAGLREVAEETDRGIEIGDLLWIREYLGLRHPMLAAFRTATAAVGGVLVLGAR